MLTCRSESDGASQESTPAGAEVRQFLIELPRVPRVINLSRCETRWPHRRASCFCPLGNLLDLT